MEDVALGIGISRRTLNEKVVKLGIDKGSLAEAGEEARG